MRTLVSRHAVRALTSTVVRWKRRYLSCNTESLGAGAGTPTRPGRGEALVLGLRRPGRGFIPHSREGTPWGSNALPMR